MSRQVKELYEFGDFRLDVGERKLERLDGSTNGTLPEKAFQTLVHLVRNSGSLVTKDELLSAVWPDAVVEENNLGKAVHAIRQHLGDKSGDDKYVQTVPKHGYRFVAEVRRPAGDGRVRATEEHVGNTLSAHEEVAPRLVPAISRFAAVAVLIGLVGVGGWYAVSKLLRQSWSRESSTTGEFPAAAARARLERSPAYDLYVRGKVKVAGENREDTEAAINLLEEAVRIDPELAEAYAQLARGYNTMAFKYSAGADSKSFHENAEVAIEKALTLNPDLAEAHFARGLILWSNAEGFPHEKAIQSYKRALALDPNQDEAYHQLSMVYSHIGLFKEAERSVNKALELNPNNTLARYRAGVYVAYQGRFDEAIATFKTIPRDFTPLLVDRSIAEALIQAGRTDEAEAIADDYLRKFPQDEGGSFTSVKALLLAKAGKKKEAKDAIRRAAEIGDGYGHFHHTAYNIACAYAAMNLPEEAVKWLETTVDTGFPNYPYFTIDPNLQSIRNDPRFIAFMAKLKPQWERFKSLG